MKPKVSLRRALADRKLLGGALAGPSWEAWRVLLIAAAGERLTDSERAIFHKGGGDTVSISRGLLGSYNLQINDSNKVFKVKRVK